MNRNVLKCLLASLLVLAGGAAAQIENATYAATASPDAPANAYAAAASTHVRLRLEPAELWLRPGQSLATRLGAQADVAQMLQVEVAGAEAPLAVALEANTFNVSPGEWDDHVNLTFAAGDVIQAGEDHLDVNVTSDTGETQTLAVLVHLVANDTSSAPRTEAALRPGWRIGFTPRQIGAHPGDAGRVGPVARSGAGDVSGLSRAGAAGASPPARSLDVGADARRDAILTLRVPDQGTQRFHIDVQGSEAQRERREGPRGASADLGISDTDPYPSAHTWPIMAQRDMQMPPPPTVASRDDAELLHALQGYLRARGLEGQQVVVLVVDPRGGIETQLPEGTP